jgi:DNA-directed RNA polymerase I subunit RPA49
VLRPAPLHLLTRRVKALKCDVQEESSALQWQEARAALGVTFGTKKAKASIRARERNRVDVAAMESAVGHLQDRIEMNTESLPTKG